MTAFHCTLKTLWGTAVALFFGLLLPCVPRLLFPLFVLLSPFPTLRPPGFSQILTITKHCDKLIS